MERIFTIRLVKLKNWIRFIIHNLNLSRFLYSKSLKPLLNELKYARILAWFVHGSPNIRRFVFKHYGKALSELLADVIMGEKKYSGWMKNPLSYLKLLKS